MLDTKLLNDTKNETVFTNAETHKKCIAIVKDEVCIQADVKIDPKVTIGEIKMFCEDPVIGKCCRVTCSKETCEFAVSQTICIEIPFTFSAETKVYPAGHVCGTPEFEPCNLCE